MRIIYRIQRTIRQITLSTLYTLGRFKIGTHFMPLVFFYTPWKHQPTSDFLIFWGFRKGSVAWIRLQGPFLFVFSLEWRTIRQITVSTLYTLARFKIGTQFMPLVFFYTPWKHQPTSDFLIFWGFRKGSVAWIRLQGPFLFVFSLEWHKNKSWWQHLLKLKNYPEMLD